MTPFLALALVAAVPFVLAVIFRVSSIFLFLSVAAGELLSRHLADNTSLVLSSFIRSSQLDMLTRVALLLLPVLLTLLILRKTLPTSRFLLHLLPLALTCLALAELVSIKLTNNFQESVNATKIGSIVHQSQDVIIGAAAITVLLLMWQSYRHKEDKVKRRKH